MFQAFKTFFWETEIRGNGEKKTEVTLYIFTRPHFILLFYKTSYLNLEVNSTESQWNSTL
jgi:hypothetical protein